MGVDEHPTESSTTEVPPRSFTMCLNPGRSFVYKAHLALHIASGTENATNAPHHRTLCWLLEDGTLTWTTCNESVATVHCRDASIDASDFLNERFFITTMTDETYTCYSKSRLERDAWMHALMATLNNNAPKSPTHDDSAGNAERFAACAAAVCDTLTAWASVLTDLIESPYGMWKETRHWRRFGVAERRPYMELQAKMNSTVEVDGLSLVMGLFVYHQNPMMIVTILCQLARLMDTCPSQIEMYWPQILHWGITFYSTSQSVNMQLFYLAFVAGVCRRSLPLAIKSSWECDAAKVGALADPSRYAAISLIQCYTSMLSVTDNNTATSDMVDTLFQRSSLEPETSKARQLLLQSLFTATSSLLCNHPTSCPAVTSVFGQWLGATTADAIDTVRDAWLVLSTFVDPLPAPTHRVPPSTNAENLRGRMVNADDMLEWLQELQMETDRGSAQSHAAPHVVFRDTMHIVNSLIVASQNFKLQLDNPRDRKKHLPAVLERLRATMPAHAMLPLDDPCWITDVIVNEGTVFSTKARAPTMVWFEAVHVAPSSDARAPVVALSPVVYLSDVLLADILSPIATTMARTSCRDVSMTETNMSVLDSCAMHGADDASIVTAMQSFADKKRRIRTSRANHANVRIMCCGDDCGLMEVLTDSMSISDAKKQFLAAAPPGCASVSLVDVFVQRYGDPDSTTFAIKDRHNGNVMLHAEGFVMHIDFGFCFGTAPGGAFSIEGAPFKLTDDMVAVMGTSGMATFQAHVAEGLVALRRHATRVGRSVMVACRSCSIRSCPSSA
ncbi:hypothetical protein DYB32_004804 [Aphanomyces invadans]|uniref:PI3K/PI4K catalytic domain-containing protein n=1 Tax=Aphanomyces invadans TaxID=157072 RepID=A0A418AWF5_9STRA|nr:hypothetical protein DYB32_004804 [Aphanomyces invadans]